MERTKGEELSLQGVNSQELASGKNAGLTGTEAFNFSGLQIKSYGRRILALPLKYIFILKDNHSCCWHTQQAHPWVNRSTGCSRCPVVRGLP